MDLDNQFLSNYSREKDNVFCLRKCLRWVEFLLNQRFKVNHDFLVNYGAGRDAFEEKPVN